MSDIDKLRALFPDTPTGRLYDAEAHLVHEIAQLLHDARKRAGLSQAKLAKRAQADEAGLGDEELADYANARLSTIAHLFAALDCELEVTLKPARYPMSAARDKDPKPALQSNGVRNGVSTTPSRAKAPATITKRTNGARSSSGTKTKR